MGPSLHIIFILLPMRYGWAEIKESPAKQNGSPALWLFLPSLYCLETRTFSSVRQSERKQWGPVKSACANYLILVTPLKLKLPVLGGKQDRHLPVYPRFYIPCCVHGERQPPLKSLWRMILPSSFFFSTRTLQGAAAPAEDSPPGIQTCLAGWLWEQGLLKGVEKRSDEE